MPPRKSSPTKAKKSPSKRKSKGRSRSRSASASRTKVSTRSRSRSASRASVVTEVVQERQSRKDSPTRPPKPSPAKAVAKASPGRPSKASPGRPSITREVQKEAIVTPTRVSKRIIEKTSSYQVTRSGGEKGGVTVTKSSTTVRTSSNAAECAEGGLGYAGAAMFVVLLVVVYLLAMSCNKSQCAVTKVPLCPANWREFFSLEIFGFVIAFHVVMAILALVPVGSVVQGQPTKDGKRLNYRCNAWLTILVAATAFGYCVRSGIPVEMSYVHDHLLQFVTSDVILTILVSVQLFIMGRNAPASERSYAADGTFWNDFMMGRVLNPRWCKLDVKHYLFRCTMIAWIAIDWMYVMDSYSKTQKVAPALGLVVLCHTFYVLFSLKNESTWFSASDFMKEGGGFLFTWAGLCFLPYVCSLQTRFLYLYPEQGLTNNYVLGALFILNAVGLMFFIGSNWQKNEFRKNPYNPDLAHHVSIPTPTGKRLLCSGWWGIVRRPNYLGDLLMALAWTLPCGFNYGVPYTYLVYLVILLVSRVISDEKSCHSRYGDAWVKYTEAVRYRLIPYVF